MSIDQRRYDRRTLEVEVNMESDDNFYAGITSDVSEGGVFVATYAPPPIGTPIDLMITLPNGYQVVAVGMVCWVRSVDAARGGSAPGCGIQWHVISERALQEIRSFVSERDTLFMEV